MWPLLAGAASLAADRKREREHGLPKGILSRVCFSGDKGCAHYGTSVAELRGALLSLAPSASLGRAMSIAAAECAIGMARKVSVPAERPGTGGRPAQLMVGAVDRYRAALTVEGRGNHDKLTIGIRRASAVEGEETARRRPTSLTVRLPKRGVHQAYELYLPAALVELRADGTYGLKVGWHQFKSSHFNQLIDVHVTKIG